MKKEFFAISMSLLIGAGMMTGCGASASETKKDAPVDNSAVESSDDTVYEFKLADVAAPDDVQYISLDYFAELLNERSGGRIKATHYGNAVVGSSNQEQVEMVMEGSLQFTTTPGYVLSALNSELKEFNISDYPFLFETTEEINDFCASEISADMREEAGQALGLDVRPGFNMGWYAISSNVGPVRTPEDLAGLKIRSATSELYVATLQAWDINTTMIAYSELYTAMQQGAADGMSLLAPLYVYQKFYEVQDYLGAIDYVGMIHWPVISQEWYNSLPDDLQTTFDECFDEYLAYTRKLHNEVETSSLEELEELGMVVTVPTEEEKKSWIDASKCVWDEKADFVGADFMAEVRTFLGK